jgi:translocation and assembly module TamB
MKRLIKIGWLVVGLLIGLPLLAVAVLVVGANTDTGRDLIARAAANFSGGMVTIDGFSGRFPDALGIDTIVVSDASGPWLRVERARVDWSPLRLIHGEVSVERLAADHVLIARLPKSLASSSTDRGGLPLAVNIRRFRIERLDLAAPVAGGDASLRITGDLALVSPEEGRVALAAKRLDGDGSYRLSGSRSANALAAQINIAEPAHGLVSTFARLPDLGALSMSASLDGPRNDEALRIRMTAGPLEAAASGRIDLAGRSINLDFTVVAPAMSPRPDLSWQSMHLHAQVHGAFTGPTAIGQLDIQELRAGTGSLRHIAADLQGGDGVVELAARADQLRLPGAPALFSAAPVELRAQAKLKAAQRPVTFTLTHPLLTASGTIDTGDTVGAPAGSITMTIPSLAPYAAIAGTDIHGQARLNAKFVLSTAQAAGIDMDGTIGITGGLPIAFALIGDRATLALSAALHGSDVSLSNLAINGKAFAASLKGTRTAGVVDLDWQTALSDLSVLSPRVAGSLLAQGHLSGPPQNLAAAARFAGAVAMAGLPKENFTASLEARGLPGAPAGKIKAEGRFAGAPLQLLAAAERGGDGTLALTVDRLQWKSAAAAGKFTLPPGASIPIGQLHLHMGQLADLAPLTGMTAKGSFDATIDALERQERTQLRIHAAARRLAIGATGADQLVLDAQVSDPTARPLLNAAAAADGIRQNTIVGNARLIANGPLDSLGLRLTSDLRLPGPATLSAAAIARLPQRYLEVSALAAAYSGETVRLLAPARISVANGLAVDNLRLGIGGATLTVSGRVTPALAVTVTARDITPAIVKPLLPDLRGTGTMAFNGELRGTPTAPTGTLRLTGRSLRITTGWIGGLPGADIDATASLAGSSARLDARLAAGKAVQLTLAGSAPTQPAGPMALRLTGNADLAMLDPLLTPAGRAARGQTSIDLALGGTLAAPRPTGTMRLAKGEVQDFVQGIHISDVAGLLRADGNTIRIDEVAGRAGSGTLSVAGTIGLLQPSLPLSLTVTARHAQLPATDLLNATSDADLTVHGDLAGTLTVGGKIHVAKANINIPNSLPQSVAVLNVRRLGSKPTAPAAPGLSIGLALTIDAPQQVFVRGRGLDAEMGGTLKIGGTSASPTVDGGFDLRNGTFSLVGQTLTFTSGKIAFGGTGLSGKLDPTLNFVAQSTANNITATLTVTGYADAPKIQLSSSPELPQDEILGRLLFGQSTQQLSPFQLAEVAQAAASFGGVGGGDPLGAVRRGLGLDRLSVGSASGSSSGATVEAGKYVAKGVYVGARQGTTGGFQAKVQIDLTKHLKVQTTLGTGSTPTTGITPENDPGSSIGLTYGFEY